MKTNQPLVTPNSLSNIETRTVSFRSICSGVQLKIPGSKGRILRTGEIPREKTEDRPTNILTHWESQSLSTLGKLFQRIKP